MTIHNYKKKVRGAALRRDGEALYNGSLDHAAILTEAMFGHANDCVCIFSGSLNAHVYGKAEVLENARLFLADPSHKVKVILENPDSIDVVDHPFVTSFKSNDDVEFRTLPNNISKKVAYHFTVMDGDSYRFEKNKNEPSAIAAFGDGKGGKNLSDIFDVLWDASSKWDLN